MYQRILFLKVFISMNTDNQGMLGQYRVLDLTDEKGVFCYS